MNIHFAAASGSVEGTHVKVWCEGPGCHCQAVLLSDSGGDGICQAIKQWWVPEPWKEGDPAPPDATEVIVGT